MAHKLNIPSAEELFTPKDFSWVEIVRKADLQLPQSIVGQYKLPLNVYMAHLILSYWCAAETDTGHIPANITEFEYSNGEQVITADDVEDLLEHDLLKKDHQGGGYRLTHWADIATQKNLRDSATRPSKLIAVQLLEYNKSNISVQFTPNSPVEKLPLHIKPEHLSWTQEELEDPNIWY